MTVNPYILKLDTVFSKSNHNHEYVIQNDAPVYNVQDDQLYLCLLHQFGHRTCERFETREQVVHFINNFNRFHAPQQHINKQQEAKPGSIFFRPPCRLDLHQYRTTTSLKHQILHLFCKPLGSEENGISHFDQFKSSKLFHEAKFKVFVVFHIPYNYQMNVRSESLLASDDKKWVADKSIRERILEINSFGVKNNWSRYICELQRDNFNRLIGVSTMELTLPFNHDLLQENPVCFIVHEEGRPSNDIDVYVLK
jgi:hypothetical protein